MTDSKLLRNVVRLYRNRRYELALSELLGLDDESERDPEVAYYIGLCYTQLERYEDALLYLEQVVTTDTNLLHIYQSRMILSYIYSITGRVQLAAFELESLLSSGYESTQVYAAYGFVAYAMHNVDDALSYLQRAIKLDPENANALNSLGFILAEEGRDLEQALEVCKKAVDRNPENSAYLDSLGWAHFKLGHAREARSYLRRALSLSGGSKEIAAHMKAAMQAGG